MTCSFCTINFNSFMFKIGKCHLMWNCPSVQQLLINLTNLCQTKHLYIELNQGTFMFGEYKTRENIRQSNIIFMTIKQYTYRSR